MEWRSFVKKLAAVRTEAGWGFIDDKGVIIVEPQALEEPRSLGRRTYFKSKTGVGMVNNVEGSLVFPAIYGSIKKFGDKLFLFSSHSKSYIFKYSFLLIR